MAQGFAHKRGRKGGLEREHALINDAGVCDVSGMAGGIGDIKQTADLGIGQHGVSPVRTKEEKKLHARHEKRRAALRRRASRAQPLRWARLFMVSVRLLVTEESDSSMALYWPI